jgi:hypothetical protein
MVQVRKQTTNEPREKQMRSEFIGKYLMGQRWMTEFRMGRTIQTALDVQLTLSQKKALGIRRALADLVVFYPDKLEIYEFQVVPRWSKFGQLVAYMDLARQTDELRAWWDKPIVGILVNAVDDAFLAHLCREHGLLYQVYSPEWLPLYFETLRARDYTPIQLAVPQGSVG